MAFLLDIGRASMWAANAIVSSATGGAVGHQEAPPKVVLVPPLFERDLRLRSRSECPRQGARLPRTTSSAASRRSLRLPMAVSFTAMEFLKRAGLDACVWAVTRIF